MGALSKRDACTCSGNSATNAYAIPWGMTVRPTVKPAMRSATPKMSKKTQKGVVSKCKQKSALCLQKQEQR